MMVHLHAENTDVPEVLRGDRAALVALRGPGWNAVDAIVCYISAPVAARRRLTPTGQTNFDT